MNQLLKESYLALKHTLPKDSVQIVVTRTAHSVLAPSWDLLNTFNKRKNELKAQGLDDVTAHNEAFDSDMMWYANAYVNEITNRPEAIKKMKEIYELSQEQDVYLICVEKSPPKHCHRHILIKLIHEYAESEQWGTKITSKRNEVMQHMTSSHQKGRVVT